MRSLLIPLSDCFAEVIEHRGRTALQMIGITLGVASIVTTFALLKDTRRQSVRYYEMTGGINKITIYGDLSGRKAAGREHLVRGLLYRDALLLEQRLPRGDVVSPTILRRAIVRAGFTEDVLNVTGVTPSFAAVQALKAADGRFLAPVDEATGSPVAVIGSAYAQQFFGTTDCVGRKLMIDEQWYTVVGRLERRFLPSPSGGNELEWMNRQILVPLASLPPLRSEPLDARPLSSIVVTVSDAWNTVSAAEEIGRLLKALHGVEDFRIVSRVERLKRANEIRRMYDVTFMSCGAISLLVGGAIIMNIQLASLAKRIREVGIRKACGASDLQVFLSFAVESLLVSLCGGILGLPTGYSLTVLVKMFTGTLATIEPAMMMMGLAVAAGTGFIFGLYPAIRAARLDPVEALRVE